MAIPIKMRASVVEIVQYADDVYQVVFVPEKKKPHFKSGQFLHLSMDEYDQYTGLWPESRVFSIASSSNREQIVIVYSVKGNFTQRMKKELVVDTVVWLKFPYGTFTIDAYELTQDIVLIAGGTGISPFIPFLEAELEARSPRRILLVYGIRGENCFLFEDLLKKCCRLLGGFELALFNAQPIDFIHLLSKASLLHNPHYFISGPPEMIKSLQSFLSSNAIEKNNIHLDAWN